MIPGMRLIIAVLVSTAILGGLAIYMAARPERVRSLQHLSESWATGQFDLEVTLTFDAGPDPFALEADDAPSLIVLFRGQEILRRSGEVGSGQVIRVEEIGGITAGVNRFFIKAVPQDSASLQSRAVRVRVFRDGVPVADQTLWSEPGQPVEGEVVVEVPAIWLQNPRGAQRDDPQ